MNYNEFLDYLAKMPSFSPNNVEKGKDPFNLDNISLLLSYLGNPQEHLKYIHIAGTNGKGSVCAYVQAMLTEEGKRVGFFTSPHLVSVNERIRINNCQIDDDKFRILTSTFERFKNHLSFQIKNEDDFRDYAENKFKEVFGDELDEDEMNETIDGIIDDNQDAIEDGDWGKLVGILNKSFTK